MGSVEQYDAAAIAYQGPFSAVQELMNVICVIHSFVHLILLYSIRIRFIFVCTYTWFDPPVSHSLPGNCIMQ